MAEIACRCEASADLLDIHVQGTRQFGKALADGYIEGLDKAICGLQTSLC